MLSEAANDEAILWHVRLSNPAVRAADWAAFTDWLEADTAHSDAYDEVARADAMLNDTLDASGFDAARADNDNQPTYIRWYRRRARLAVAASALLALLASPFLLSGRTLQKYETKAGETREIALADGSQIVMNGSTKLALDAKSGRFARLTSGEAVFTIHHDQTHPFIVETPGSTLRDLGTLFDVRQDDDGLEVGVAQGAIEYNPSDEALTVSAGSLLKVSRAHPVPVVTRGDPHAVASWRHGRLTYQDARLSRIAADLTRALGIPISVSPEVAARQFTGVIRVDTDQRRLFHTLESLLGVRAQHNTTGWLLTI